MGYLAPIQRSDPTAFLFLVDQSGSMGDRMPGEKTKAQFVADVLNRTLMNLVVRCTRAEGVRNYFEAGVVGYGDTGAANGFSGALGGKILHPISEIEAHPLRVEDRKKKVDDGAGGLVEQNVKFPVWFQPVSNGGTPMCAAFTTAAEALVAWCDQHRASYPPTVLHVTDGQSTDGDPEQLADMLRQISTDDGQALLLNIHVSDSNASPIKFPSSASGLPDDYARLLFRMSSLLPDHLIKVAQEKGGAFTAEARGFVFNADAAEIVEFFDIGTRASQLR